MKLIYRGFPDVRFGSYSSLAKVDGVLLVLVGSMHRPLVGKIKLIYAIFVCLFQRTPAPNTKVVSGFL